MEATIARDGSGTFNLAGAAFVNGTTADADAVNSDLSDIASGLTGSLAKDGQTVPTANLPMGGFKHAGVADGSARTDYASLGQLAKGTVDYAADTGAADAYVIAPSPGIAANVVGFKAKWKVTNTNLTTTPTLATNLLTTGTIVWPDGSALAAGDLPGGAVVETIIASLSGSTPTWHLQTPTSSSPVTKAGTQTISGAKTFTGNALFSKLIVSGGSSFVPQGRLTLVTAVPVMISSQASKTTVFYTPFRGNLIPLSDGVNFLAGVFAELSNDLTASSVGSAGPAVATTNSNYDLFVWSNAGVPTLTRGPPWTSGTARGTGAGTTELQRFLGLWTNKVAITNGPGANLGTYVGTIRTDGSSQANWVPGAVAASGTAAILGVWNAYNRVDVRGQIGDSTNSYTYGSSAPAPAGGSSTMRVSFVIGLQEDFIGAEHAAVMSSAAGASAAAGIGYDVTNAFSGRRVQTTAAGGGLCSVTGRYDTQPLGFHFMQALEWVDTFTDATFYGDNGAAIMQTGLSYQGAF